MPTVRRVWSMFCYDSMLMYMMYIHCIHEWHPQIEDCTIVQTSVLFLQRYMYMYMYNVNLAMGFMESEDAAHYALRLGLTMFGFYAAQSEAGTHYVWILRSPI